MALEIKPITSFAGFCALEGPWEEVVAATPEATPFCTHAWLRTWWEAFGGRGRPLVLTAWEGQRMVGGLALHWTRTRLLKVLPVRCLDTWSNPHSFGYNLICRDEFLPEFLAEIRRYLCTISLRWDILVCSRHQSPERVYDLMGSTFNASPTAIEFKNWNGSYVLDIGPDFPAYFNSLGKSFTSTRTYQNRRLEREGKVSFWTGTEFDAARFAEFCKIEDTGWKKTGKSSILSSPETRQFYEQVARRFGPQGHYLLAMMHLNNEPIASMMGVVYRGTYYFLKTGTDFDRAEFARKHSPGQAIIQRMLQHCFENHFKRFDFTGPLYDYEVRWTKRIQYKRNIVIYNRRSPMTLAYLMLRRLAQAVRRPPAETKAADGAGEGGDGASRTGQATG